MTISGDYAAQEGAASYPAGETDATPLTFEAAKAAETEAGIVLNAARAALETAIRAVRAEHVPIIERADSDYRRAKRLALDAQSAETPDHEWEGRIVEGPESSWKRLSATVRGVVFTYRPGANLGRGHAYTRPEPGDVFVRLLKKDGTPSARTISFGSRFKLVEPTS